MSKWQRPQRAKRNQNRAIGVAAVPAVLLLMTLPTGDSWSPNWILATVEVIVLVVSLLAAWSFAGEAKQIEEEDWLERQ